MTITYTYTTKFLAAGDSATFRDIRIYCIGIDQYGQMRCRLNWPWGYTEEFQMWLGGYIWKRIFSDDTEDFYDRRYDYVVPAYRQKVRFDVVDVFDSGNYKYDRIQVKITDEVTQYAWYLNNRSATGSDSNTGLNWDHALETLDETARRVAPIWNSHAYIANGNYMTQPGTTGLIAPPDCELSSYIIEKLHDDYPFEIQAGEAEIALRYKFAHEEWGEYVRYWNANDKTYDYCRGWHADITNFVSSDKLISEGYGMEVLTDNDTRYREYAGGRGIVLPEGWLIYVSDVSFDASKANIEIYQDGDLKDTIVVRDGDDLIYEHTVRGVKLPIIVTHVEHIFSGSEAVFVEFNGFVQLSSAYYSLT